MKANRFDTVLVRLSIFVAAVCALIALAGCTFKGGLTLPQILHKPVIAPPEPPAVTNTVRRASSAIVPRIPRTNVIAFHYAPNMWALDWSIDESTDGGLTWREVIRHAGEYPVVTNGGGVCRLYRVRGSR